MGLLSTFCLVIFALWSFVDLFWRISTWELRQRKLELEVKYLTQLGDPK